MNRHTRIFLIDDDEALGLLLEEQFSLHKEFQLSCFGRAKQALSAIETEPPHLILLDVKLPDCDGRQFAKTLRQEGYMSPIIMLTAQTGKGDEMLGFEAGANDYIAKPFHFGVLLARIRAQLDLYQKTNMAEFLLGDMVFVPAKKHLKTKKGSLIYLTEKEVGILRFLLSSPSHFATRRALLDNVWAYKKNIDTHTLETHIYRLRQKIEKNPAKPSLLITIAQGYQLNLSRS